MTCFDIVFPLNLGPLTYRCPDSLKSMAEPGMIVSAPLRKGMATGLIYKKAADTPAAGLRDIAQIHGTAPVLSSAALKLIAWMSEYYLAPEGLVLKQALPKELFRKTKRRKKEGASSAEVVSLPGLQDIELPELPSELLKNHYQTILIHVPSLIHEYSVAASILRHSKNVIILFPEIAQAELFYQSVKNEHGDRVCILHSDMSEGRRSEGVDAIIAGKHDIVIGTRTALFAPLKRLSLVMVANEHSGSYKLEEGLMFNVRDVAVKRGFLEKIPVLLLSPCPSIDSWFNAKSGKYSLMRHQPGGLPPRITISDLRFIRKGRPYLSEEVISKTKKTLQKSGRVLFIINRRGHSTVLKCAVCGNSESCPNCLIPLVLHKDRNLLECHYCGGILETPDVCSKCSSPKVEKLGAGTQRIEEDLRDLFGMDALRFDSDSAGRKTEVQGLLKGIASGTSRIIVGTKMLTGRLNPNGSFSLAVLLNVDCSLNLPDFRSREKTYQEIISVRDLVAVKGEVIVQTRFPMDTLFRHLRSDDYEAFAKEELEIRAALQFPPYARLLKIIAYGDAALAENIIRTLNRTSGHVEVLGPTERKTKKGTEYSFLLKHGERKVLHAAAHAAIRHFRNAGATELRIDADPY